MQPTGYNGRSNSGKQRESSFAAAVPPLVAAACNGELDCALLPLLLRTKGVQIEARARSGETALIATCRANVCDDKKCQQHSASAVAKLRAKYPCAANAAPSCPGCAGCCASERAACAAESRLLGVVGQLLLAGADVSASTGDVGGGADGCYDFNSGGRYSPNVLGDRDKKYAYAGWSAIEWARSHRYDKVVRALRSAGAKEGKMVGSYEPAVDFSFNSYDLTGSDDREYNASRFWDDT